MIDQFHHRGWHYLLLAAVGAMMFFLNLGGPTLWDIDEGRNANCAYEMMDANNWIVPSFNGKLRVDKPVMLYWLQILSYMAFGVNEFAARFPSALAALATVLLAYELARSMFSRTTGLIAGMVVASTPMVCGAGRFANPDALLNCFTVLTLAIYWIGLAQRRWWWFVLLGISTGLAVLAKGPVGLVLPCAVITLFLLWQRQLGLLWDARISLAGLAFTLTAIPWYVLVGLETHGEFLKGFLWTHNLERGLSTMESHDGFPGYYLVILLVGMTPWSIFLGLALWFGAWSTIRCPWIFCQSWWSAASEIGAEETDNSRTDRPAAYRLLLCWIIVYVFAFSMSATKLPNYVLPATVPCALLIARFLQRWRTSPLPVPDWLVQTGVGVLLFVGVALAVALTLLGGVGEWKVLRGQFFPGLEHWAVLGLIPIMAAMACWWFARTRQHSRFIVTFAVCSVLFLAPMAAFASAILNARKAPQALVEQTDADRRDEDIRIGCCLVDHLPSLNFYLKRNVEPLYIENVADFLNSRLTVYVFISQADWQSIAGTPGVNGRVVARHYDMYHRNELLVVTNR